MIATLQAAAPPPTRKVATSFKQNVFLFNLCGDPSFLNFTIIRVQFNKQTQKPC